MVDFLSPDERSKRMAQIRSSNTSPELILRRELHRLGLRFTLDNKRLPGKPDLVFPRHRAIVFVHGCFWHRHPGCSIATTPKSNTSFWQEKFDRNVARDDRVAARLDELGWRVIVAWECTVQSRVRARETAERLVRLIRTGDTQEAQGRVFGLNLLAESAGAADLPPRGANGTSAC
ncbi:very short patch repair endonuclease [Mesorhizobium sp.]|uniref:very short patch repair endonuclease n=1 Tax=Mesorhizobium sp. TaxID=1871066 RepID=UPI003561F43E